MHFPEKGIFPFGVVLDGKSHQHQGNRHNGKTENAYLMPSRGSRPLNAMDMTAKLMLPQSRTPP